MIQFKQLSNILIAACLIASSGCKPHDGVRNCYDVENLKKTFDNIRNININAIPLYKELEANAKNLDQIKTEYGEPIEEYVDTFRYGRHVNNINFDLSIDPYYDVFPDTLWKIPLLIIHKCTWAQGNKDVTLFFLNDCHNGEQPVWGYIYEYNADYLPLRLLAEKDLSFSEVVKKRGLPIFEDIYEVFNGVDYPPMEDIYSLRDVPVATIHAYLWEADSVRSLILIYLEDDNKDTAKPVWGFQCHDRRLDLE